MVPAGVGPLPLDKQLLHTPLTHSLWSCTHGGTALSCTPLCDGPIQHIDLIEEVNS